MIRPVCTQRLLGHAAALQLRPAASVLCSLPQCQAQRPPAAPRPFREHGLWRLCSKFASVFWKQSRSLGAVALLNTHRETMLTCGGILQPVLSTLLSRPRRRAPVHLKAVLRALGVLGHGAKQMPKVSLGMVMPPQRPIFGLIVEVAFQAPLVQ